MRKSKESQVGAPENEPKRTKSLLRKALRDPLARTVFATLLGVTASMIFTYTDARAYEVVPPQPIEITKGPEKNDLGNVSAFMIAGKSRNPSQERVSELVEKFSRMLVLRGVDPAEMTLFAPQGSATDFPGSSFTFSEKPVEDTLKALQERIATASGPVIVAAVAHGQNIFGQFNIYLEGDNKISSNQLAESIALGILKNQQLENMPIILVWESCESGGSVIGGPDDTTPFNDKGLSSLDDQITRHIKNFNPTYPVNKSKICLH